MITGRPTYIPEALVGRTLGKYQVQEIIGRGGMGVVFRVWDTLEDQPKAIKMVPPELATSPLAFEDLKREISLASGIIHPNVVKVLSLEAQDGQYFIVMEFIEGESLEKKMAWTKERRLNEADVIRVMKKTAEALVQAHAKMIIHRDLKPRNIMEAKNGEVKVLDFGISHRMGRSMTELTGVNNTGTWPYMAPEQLSNNFGREDQQVDIWALGVTMYQLLSGDIPFRNREQIIDLKEKPFPFKHVSRRTSFIVLKCLEKDRKKRYQHMVEVLKDLEALEKSFGSVEEKEQRAPLSELLEWPRVVAAVILILAVVFLYYSLKVNRTFRYDIDLQSRVILPMSEARQEYENNIKEAEAAAVRGDYSAAISLLDKAKKIAVSPRLIKLSREFTARAQSRDIKTDFRELTAFLDGPAPQGEKIEKSRLFLEKYKDLSNADAETAALISQIQAALNQLQLRTVPMTDVAGEIATGYNNKIRRVEVPGLPEGIRVLGFIRLKLQVSAKGVISVQSIDDTALKVTDQSQVEPIKQMIVRKLNTVSLPPPRDKSNAPVKVRDWPVTFKVGTFQSKIILLSEG
ncbi:MAG: Non-specific serine/threonine protein kinase [Acidobacteriota bacterium]|nr:Non-specific serine/threonine protein kinase [Acidobacteriota bacterium]